MVEAINYTVERVVNYIFDSEKKQFVGWFLHTFKKGSTYTYKDELCAAVIKVLGNAGFDTTKYDNRETAIEALEQFYDIVFGLPAIYKTVLRAKRFIDFEIPYTQFFVKAIKQNAKGVKKYGVDIDECPDGAHDWQEMAIEEIIDYLVYLEKYKVTFQTADL